MVTYRHDVRAQKAHGFDSGFRGDKVFPPGHDGLSHSRVRADQAVDSSSDQNKSRTQPLVDDTLIMKLPSHYTEINNGEYGGWKDIADDGT